MELIKIKAGEIASFDLGKLKESEEQIRQELANLRLDIFAERGKHSGKKRQLRKSLARVLTVKTLKTKSGRGA